MDDIINLSNEAAALKLRELTKEVNICMFSTNLSGENGAATRPMASQHTESDLNIWFISDKNSHKNKEIAADPRVQLYFAEPTKSTFVTITGRAEVVPHDKKIVEEIWNPLMKTWFQEGKDDPSLSLIKVVPEEGYYWDSKGNKFVNFFKMLGSLVVGKDLVGSEEGKLRPNNNG